MPDDLGKGDAEKNAKTIFQGVNLVEGKKRYLFLSINISISVSIYGRQEQKLQEGFK